MSIPESTHERTASAQPAGRPGRPSAARRIIHVDMDAFFASVEQLDDPALRGKPVAVGGDPNDRGVVAAASYEARRHGVRSAMSMRQALRLCPELIRVRPRLGRYIEMSRRIRQILMRWTPAVEMASLDEAYLDVSGLPQPAGEIASRIKAEIHAGTGLTASAGVGPSKLVAKIASDACKPDGLMVVRPSRVRGFLAPLPVGTLRGVGPVTGRKLGALGIRTVGDLARADAHRVTSRLGSLGETLVRMARGEDDRPVEPRRPTRSISCERTLSEDTRDLSLLDRLIDRFSSEIQSALRTEGLRARTVSVKIRTFDFRDATRSHTLRAPIDDAPSIAREARALLTRTSAGRRKVRLIGVSVSGIVPAGEPWQTSLFT